MSNIYAEHAEEKILNPPDDLVDLFKENGGRIVAIETEHDSEGPRNNM